MLNLKYLIVLTVLICGVHCWDHQELEIFDLVEEINENFYTVLGINQVCLYLFKDNNFHVS